MLWIKAGHIIFVITWFAALFYLPRLFVYQVESPHPQVHATLRIMQRKLYYYIMWPSSVAATGFGLVLFWPYHAFYSHASWMQLKLLMVLVLWCFQISCGHYRQLLLKDESWPSGRFFRIYNEIPTLVLFVTVIAVVIKPWL